MAAVISAKDMPWAPNPLPPNRGILTITQIPDGELTSIKFNRFITAPAGMKILNMVPGSCLQAELSFSSLWCWGINELG